MVEESTEIVRRARFGRERTETNLSGYVLASTKAPPIRI